MKKQVIVSLLILFPVLFYAQDAKLSKSEKKEQKKVENDEQLKALYKIVESRQFVVEADQVYSSEGEIFNVMSSVNFFAVDSAFSTIQLSFVGLVGWNGVGGVTVDGRIDRFDINEFVSDKPITLNGSIIPRSGGNAQFTMYVYSTGMANVTVTGNWGSSITFQGRLFTLADSKVFKGIPTN